MQQHRYTVDPSYWEFEDLDRHIEEHDFPFHSHLFGERLQKRFDVKSGDCTCRIEMLKTLYRNVVINGLRDIQISIWATYERTPQPKSEKMTSEQLLDFEKHMGPRAVSLLADFESAIPTTEHMMAGRVESVGHVEAMKGKLEILRTEFCEKVLQDLMDRCTGVRGAIALC